MAAKLFDGCGDTNAIVTINGLVRTAEFSLRNG